MKTISTTVIFLVLALTGCEACGNTSTGNKMVGQVKKVHRNTPLICDDYASADVSLGVVRGGTGSISTHDVTVVLLQDAVNTAERAAESGDLVEVTFDERRVAVCTPDCIATRVKVLTSRQPTKVQIEVGEGHLIEAVVDRDEVVELKLDGRATDPDSAVGKAAVKKVRDHLADRSSNSEDDAGDRQ